jgi:hypothetical protein
MMINIIAISLLTVAAPPSADILVRGGTASNPGAAPLEISDVALFKNGTGYFTAEGRLNPSETEFVISEPPPAVHGTFWLTSPVRPIWMVASVDTGWRGAQTIEELLKVNIGREVELRLDAERGPVSWFGTLRSVSGDLVTIDDRSVRLQDIREVAGADLDTRVPAPDPRLALRYLSGDAAPYSLSWLQKGITWAPVYALDIARSPGPLRLSATIFNEAHDLRAARVSFVSGYPNIAFADVLSPLSLENNLQSFLNALGGGQYQAAASPMSQMMMNAPVARFAAEADYSAAPPTTAQVEDLFYHTQPGITLAKGARASFEILSTPAQFTHVYSWDVRPDNPWNPYRPQPSEPDEEIWHLIRFSNGSDQPFTTGPILLTSDGRVVAQDVLKYTPRGAEAEVKITKAVDIAADAEEIEISREAGARRYRNSSYDLVVVEGTLTIESFKNDTVTLEIRRELEGEVTSAAENPEIVKLGENVRAINPRSRIKWTVTLPPGTERELKYRYRIFVQ